MHNNLIATEIDPEMEIRDLYHSHNETTGPFITSTDICTFMLYCKVYDVSGLTVISRNYYNFMNCGKNFIIIITDKAMKKIDQYQKEMETEEADD